MRDRQHAGADSLMVYVLDFAVAVVFAIRTRFAFLFGVGAFMPGAIKRIRTL